MLPSSIENYRLTRQSEHRAKLDSLLAAGRWVVELDGILEKPVPDTPIAKQRRERAYRLQAAVLLRNIDLLIAVTDPNDIGGAGGTRESIEKALELNVPVIAIDETDFSSDVCTTAIDFFREHDFSNDNHIPKLVRNLVLSTGEIEEGTSHKKLDSHGESMLSVFCEQAAALPKRSRSFRSQMWGHFEKFFRPDIQIEADKGHSVWSHWRNRATDLNYYYSGLYRGAFLLNFFLAVIAVAAATFSLMLLALGSPGGSNGVSTGHPVPDAILSSGLSGGLVVTLLVLAFLKLVCVVSIFRNTHEANKNRWNDRGIDFRYLAERLRLMYYLPGFANNRASPVSPARHASRAASQSAIDWLFDAIVRTSSIERPVAVEVEHSIFEHADNKVPVFRVSGLAGLRVVRDRWVRNQADYHERTRLTNKAILHWTEVWAGRLSKLVIGLVVFDVVLLSLKLLHWIPEQHVELAKAITPILIFITAVIPSAVASLNGVRSQTECQRLAERSSVMKLLLVGGMSGMNDNSKGGHIKLIDLLLLRIEASQASPVSDKGAWSGEAMLLSEAVAEDITREVAEWTVIYAKDLPEP